MADFNKAVIKTLNLEGGYSNDPNDLGGVTKYGITEKTARSYGYSGNMNDLTIDFAKNIYKKGYWDIYRLDEFKSQLIAENVFDTAVNGGNPILWLQRAINNARVDNKTGQELWPQIATDGKIGNQTISALNKALSFVARETVIVKAYNCLRGVNFIELGEKRFQNLKFELGWFLHRIWLDVKK
jgi:lysozyme family protein